MAELFSQLNRAIEGAPVLALSAALVWGVLSILLSPCHLASLPLIVGFISGQGSLNSRRALAISALFALGILITVGFIGVVTAGIGRIIGDVGPWANYVVAAVFFAVGLHLVGALPLPFAGVNEVGMRSRGLAAALLLGLVFGIALGPCTFAFMAPVLGVVFKVANSQPAYALSLLLLYGLGHCAVIMVAGASAGMVQRFLNWNEQSKATRVVRFVCGLMVLAGAGYFIFSSR